MKRRIIVYILSTGDVKIYDSMEEMLRHYISLTEARVEYCIKSGTSWRGLAFDEAIE